MILNCNCVILINPFLLLTRESVPAEAIAHPLTCWGATKNKCLFYLTKFQIKPFQLHVTKMRLFVSIGREVGIVLHILFSRSKDMSGRRITNTKGEIMNSPEKRRYSRYEPHA